MKLNNPIFLHTKNAGTHTFKINLIEYNITLIYKKIYHVYIDKSYVQIRDIFSKNIISRTSSKMLHQLITWNHCLRYQNCWSMHFREGGRLKKYIFCKLVKMLTFMNGS